MYKLAAFATIGLLSLTASAFPQTTDEEADPVSCPFNGTIGPNILVAQVECVQHLQHFLPAIEYHDNTKKQIPIPREHYHGNRGLDLRPQLVQQL